MKKLLLLALLLFTLPGLYGCAPQNAGKISDTRFAMDTFIKIDAYGTDDAAVQKAADAAFSAIQQIAAQTDRFNDGGNGSLWQLNHAAPGEAVTPAPHLAQLLQFCAERQQPEVDITLGAVSDLWLAAKQNGVVPQGEAIAAALQHSGRDKFYYDAAAGIAAKKDAGTVIDLGAVAKGYAVDAAANILQNSQAVQAALINGGGNIKAIGTKPDGKPWVIAVQHPRQSDKFLGTLILQPGQAAATSGDYQRYYEAQGERWHHLLLPQTGCPARLHQSVTVIAPSALEADYHSTLLFLKEPAAVQAYLTEHQELAAVAVAANGDVWVSPNLQQLWQPAQE